MMGEKEKDNSKVYYYGFDLSERIPKDHPLRIVKKAIDFKFVYKEVRDKYGRKGNVSVPPPIILKMMFLLFFYNVSSERELMRTIPLRLDWLWFLGYDIDTEVPHHSVLSKARKRWGKELFYKFFVQIVEQCVECGLVDGDKLFADSTLVDANASIDSVVNKESSKRYLNERYRELEEKLEEKEDKYVSTTDPDSGYVKHGRTKAKPRYKEHRGVDGRFGVITASIVSSGTVDDGAMFKPLVDMHEDTTKIKVETGVGDSKYGIADNYLICKEKGIKPHFEDLKSTQVKGGKRRGIFSSDKFEYDEETDTFICPAGKRLTRRSHDIKRKRVKYVSCKEDCDICPFRSECTKSKSGVRTVDRLERQRDVDEMRQEAKSQSSKRDLKKRWHLMEGSFADGENQHNLKKARWRGYWRVQIQEWMISAVQNIRILIKHTYLDVESGQMAMKKPEKGKLRPVNLYLIFILVKIWSFFRKKQNILKYVGSTCL
jgi:transposase